MNLHQTKMVLGFIMTVFCVAFFGGRKSYAEEEKETEKFVLILATQSAEIDQRTEMFYDEVVREMLRSSQWPLVDPENILKTWDKPAKFGVQPSKNILTIKSDEFMEALGAKGPEHQVIEKIQRTLDEQILRGAAIVRCEVIQNIGVRECGIYLYDRRASKIIAAAEKKFSHGVNDAHRWAGPLVQNLTDGLQATAKREQRAQIESLSQRDDDSQRKNSPLNWGGVAGLGFLTSAQGPADSPHSLAMWLLSLNLVRGSMRFGIEGSGGSVLQNNTHFRDYGLGLWFAPSVAALEDSRWELYVGSGFNQRKMTKWDGELLENDLYLRIRPTWYWDLLTNTSLGLGYAYTLYMNTGSRSVGSLSEESFYGSSHGIWLIASWTKT